MVEVVAEASNHLRDTGLVLIPKRLGLRSEIICSFMIMIIGYITRAKASSSVMTPAWTRLRWESRRKEKWAT